jgi:hypothetical protein
MDNGYALPTGKQEKVPLRFDELTTASYLPKTAVNALISASGIMGITVAPHGDPLRVGKGDNKLYAVFTPYRIPWGEGPDNFSTAVVRHRSPFGMWDFVIGRLNYYKWCYLSRYVEVAGKEFRKHIDRNRPDFQGEFADFPDLGLEWALPTATPVRAASREGIFWGDHKAIIPKHLSSGTAAAGGEIIPYHGLHRFLRAMYTGNPYDIDPKEYEARVIGETRPGGKVTHDYLVEAAPEMVRVPTEGKFRGEVLWVPGANVFHAFWSLYVTDATTVKKLEAEVPGDFLFRAEDTNGDLTWEVMARKIIPAKTYLNGEERYLTDEEVLMLFLDHEELLEKHVVPKRLSHASVLRAWYAFMPGAPVGFQEAFATVNYQKSVITQLSSTPRQVSQKGGDWPIGKADEVSNSTVFLKKELFPLVGIEGPPGQGKTLLYTLYTLLLYGKRFAYVPCGPAPLDALVSIADALGGTVLPRDLTRVSESVAESIYRGIFPEGELIAQITSHLGLLQDEAYQGNPTEDPAKIKARQLDNQRIDAALTTAFLNYKYREMLSTGRATWLPLIMDSRESGRTRWAALIHTVIRELNRMWVSWGFPKGLDLNLGYDNISGIPTAENDMFLGALPYQMGANLRALIYDSTQLRNSAIHTTILAHDRENWALIRPGFREDLNLVVLPQPVGTRDDGNGGSMTDYIHRAKFYYPSLEDKLLADVVTQVEGHLLKLISQKPPELAL